MKRNLCALSNQHYDLLVIGGGIYGACVAWDAVLRGLSVALVEKADFGSATSSNSLKVIHGGLRYLQHADVRRMRQSIAERKSLLRIAPHLIHPLPVLVPIYGHGLKGIEAMTCALMVNDWISCDRNLNLGDRQKHIPRGRILSKQECLAHLPGLSPEGLTGGALFYDAQVYNSERLLIAFLQSAASAGARIANYVEVTGFIRQGDRLQGVTVKDNLTDDSFDIRATTIINTSGPWVNHVINCLNSNTAKPRIQFAKAMNLVVERLLFQDQAVGLSSRGGDRSTSSSKDSSRLFFIAPWRDKSLIGTAYTPYDGDPDCFRITESEIQAFLDDVNRVYPFHLKRNDVCFVHGGMLPRSGIHSQTGEVELKKQFQLYDHRQQGINGMLSVIGVKYTTARGVAERAVDWVFQSQGQTPPKSQSATVPLNGGAIAQFESFLTTAQQTLTNRLEPHSIRRLVYNYGSAYPTVLDQLAEHPSQCSIDDADVWRAEARYSVKHEMAQKLSDIVLRRTELASAGPPSKTILSICAKAIGEELKWSLNHIDEEVRVTQAIFDQVLPNRYECSTPVQITS